ncbi:MAG TPA: rod shape-determining protein MreC [Pirellulales bacterium]|jgi:cell shape-determining protein MreC
MFNAVRALTSKLPAGASLAVTLAVGLLLAALPRRAIEPLRAAYDWCVEPGRFAAHRAQEVVGVHLRGWQARSTSAEKLAALERQIEQLTARNRELEIAIASTTPADDSNRFTNRLPPLLQVDLLPAPVLGRHACTVLATDEIIRAGRDRAILRDALALADSTTTIDGGEDAALAAGDVALAGRRVFGRVIEVGPHTSTVRRADQPGYRDVVQIAPADGGSPETVVRGVLEGTGERLARVRRVSAQLAVEVGDLVTTAEQQGLSSCPLVYGRVTRVERPPGALHCDIWVDLAIDGNLPERLLVLRARKNPARLAAAATVDRPAEESEERR